MSIPEEQGVPEIVEQLKKYLETVKAQILAAQDIEVRCVVEGSGPKRTILHAATEGGYDLIAIVSHGRGGLERRNFVKLGSVAASILSESDVLVLFVSAQVQPADKR
jgi:nucleotide-binding universal stress UspA family protein